METQDQDNFLSILLADDDKDDRFFFQEALKEIEKKTTVQTVIDGEQLLDYLSKPEIILPHVIFLDLNMPRKNGLECLKGIRNNNRFKDIIIAIYSTSASEHDVTETFLKGANLYIKKPYDYLSLKKILEKVVNINWQLHAANLNKDNFVLTI